MCDYRHWQYREESFEVSQSLKITYLLVFDFVFFWWQFALVTVGRGCLPNLVGDGTVENSRGANWILRLFYEEIGSHIGDGIYQKKSKSGCKSRISCKNSSRNKYKWSTHSQTESLQMGTEWIIHSTSYSIISVREGWWIALSCSWFERFFGRGQYEKSYCFLALQFHPDKNQHSQVSDVTKIINKAKEE